MENKIKILRENYEEYLKNCPRSPESFGEWVELESESDPGFFRWLYDNQHLKDFDCPDWGEFYRFIESL